MKRRQFLTLSAAALATPALLSRRSLAAEPGTPLPLPQVMDVDAGNGNSLNAILGQREFIAGAPSNTLGYDQDYLGPVLRFKRGATARLAITNRTDGPITTHWHGLHIPGHLDGGPQLAFDTQETWTPELPIDQPATTLWYHSHVHGKTAEQVYRGLAGLILVEDPDIADPLPRDYGQNDFPLIIQDRSFDSSGRMTYDLGMMGRMAGFQGSEMLVNGAIRPRLSVPAGLVRLRLLNASNARAYALRFDDNRSFYQVGSDGGLLPAPVAMTGLHLSSSERAEIVVDFSDGAPVRLVSTDTGMMGGTGGGMMGGMMGGSTGGSSSMMGGMTNRGASGPEFEIMSFAVSDAPLKGPQSLPATLPAQIPDLGQPVRTRDFTLNMSMGMGGMMGSMISGLIGGGGQSMGINGQSYDMGRIDQKVALGETELWRINTDMMMHPFHVHGTSFQVLSLQGKKVDQARIGMKDVVHVMGPSEILVRFDRPAAAETPFMFHCHILEHEDSGMMGQFTVT
ncbi:multicopper oxidase family protein [Brevirhabdus sp.]|uniref:multicopper oxidase family protein n=1 Tax=Brevirhabdus sp. TaxID=2004514 RepID=UPI0040587B63